MLDDLKVYVSTIEAQAIMQMPRLEDFDETFVRRDAGD
jgi:hypothetical protein